MASIIKKVKKGRAYYYAVECQRVDGQPRIVWQKYLGTVDAIVKRIEQGRPARPKETVIFEAGGVAALLGIARRLGVLELIDEVVAKRQQGPSVGHYMLLAAINRALAPCSKMALGEWYEETVLRRLWRFPKSAFTSQRFWDHMDMVSEDDIEAVQDRLVRRVKAEFGLDTSVMLYDTTNFFTFLATSNGRAMLPQRGHSKAKRNDLRQVGLALLVTREYQVPLLHEVYRGNIPDVSLFPEISHKLIARYKEVAGDCEEATLVFDKGNVSEEAMEKLVFSGTKFVSALSANRVGDLLSAPLEEFEDLPGLPGSRALSSTVGMWGKELQVVVVYSESFFTRQLSGVTQNLVKCQKKFHQLQQRLQKWHCGKGRGKRPTVRSVRRSLGEILSPQFMRQLFEVEVTQEEGLPHLRYTVDHEALQHLCERRLGRTALVTNHLHWPPVQVVGAYRNLSCVEEAFKKMKDARFLRWQPAYHWTDQKLRVHGFYCVLALLLSALARKLVLESGIEISLPALLKQLSGIREVAVIYPKGTLAHRRDHMTLSRMTPRQRRLAEVLAIGEILHRG